MKVLVVGGGGREHAVIRKLRENPEITEIFALPGNAGMRKEAVCVPIGAKDIPAIVNFARDVRTHRCQRHSGDCKLCAG